MKSFRLDVRNPRIAPQRNHLSVSFWHGSVARRHSVVLPPRLTHRKITTRVLEGEDLEFDLEAEAERFMQKQAEMESGDTSVPQLDGAVGVDSVPDEIAKKYCQDVIQSVKDLETYREMTLNEIKLTVAIDPRNREQGPKDAENESDVTRAEMANALSEVTQGKIPNDRIALKVLWEEMTTWPALDIERENPKPSPKDSDKRKGWRDGQARPPIGRDESEKPVNIEDMLPEWVGYSYLYILSAVPLMIGIVVVAILFVNSLQ